MKNMMKWIKPLLMASILLLAASHSAMASGSARLGEDKLNAISVFLNGWVQRADSFSPDRDRFLSALKELGIQTGPPHGSSKYNFLVAIEESLKANHLGLFIEKYTKGVLPVVGRELMASSTYKHIIELGPDDSKILAMRFNETVIQPHPELHPRMESGFSRAFTHQDVGVRLPPQFSDQDVARMNNLVNFLARRWDFGFLQIELDSIGIVKSNVIDWQQGSIKVAQDIIRYCIETHKLSSFFKALKEKMLAGTYRLPAEEIQLLDEVIGGVKITDAVRSEEIRLSAADLQLLDKASPTQHVKVSLQVVKVAGADRMDSALLQLNQLGAELQGSGFPLETLIPEGGRFLTLKNSAQVDLLKKILIEFYAPEAPIRKVTITPIEATTIASGTQAPSRQIAPTNRMEQTKHEDAQFLKGVTYMGADWAVRAARGQVPNEEYLAALIKFGKVLPYGRTENGVRTVSQLFLVERNSHRLIFLYPVNGQIKLMLGAVLTDEAREAIGGTSYELYYGRSNGREKFLSVFKLVVDADQKFQMKYRKNALTTDMDPLGRKVQQMGNMTVTDLDLNPDLTAQELMEFLLSLFEVTCENLLTNIK